MAGTRVPDVVRDAARQIDARLLTGWYQMVSVPTSRVRRHLRAAHKPFADPQAPDLPPLDELDRTAGWVIAQASRRATAMGGLAGVIGAASLPHEAAATVVSLVRLAQRLAVIYGFDPETDRGRMAVSQALATGFGVDLPEMGPLGVRVSDLPAVVAPKLVAPRSVGSALAGRLLSRALAMVTSRAVRVLPLVSIGPAAADQRRYRAEVGARMQRCLRNLSEAPIAAIPVFEDAQIVED